jgi:hypothetical protein
MGDTLRLDNNVMHRVPVVSIMNTRVSSKVSLIVKSK